MLTLEVFPFADVRGDVHIILNYNLLHDLFLFYGKGYRSNYASKIQ